MWYVNVYVVDVYVVDVHVNWLRHWLTRVRNVNDAFMKRESCIHLCSPHLGEHLILIYIHDIHIDVPHIHIDVYIHDIYIDDIYIHDIYFVLGTPRRARDSHTYTSHCNRAFSLQQST